MIHMENTHNKHAVLICKICHEKCIGNDSPYICLACGDEFKVDSEKPITQCPTCNAEDIVDKFKLEGKTCHACKTDVFGIDPNFFCVS